MKDYSYIVSFCIPVFNNSDATELLVTQLLSNPNPSFQVVISDDCSSDDTINRVKTIKDDRLKILENKNNVGSKLNWCRALKAGDGRYLYLVMGRDRLDCSKINRLIELLNKCNDISVIMDRRCINGISILSGVDAYKYLLRPEHPTGLIVMKDYFDSIDKVESIFNVKMAYPEINLKRELLWKTGTCGIVNSGVYIYQVNINKSVVPSKFERDVSELYFFPNRCIDDFFEYIKMIRYSDLSTEEKMELFDFYFCEVLLYEVTLQFKSYMENYETASHYELKKRYVGPDELKKNINLVKTRIHDENSEISITQKTKMDALIDSYIVRLDSRSDLGIITYRRDSIIRLLERLIYNKNKGITISRQPIIEKSNSIAIYGFSTVGKILLSELKNSTEKVKYAIDKNWSAIYSDVCVVSPEDKLPEVDLVIISLVDNIEEVERFLNNKYNKTRFISAEELVFRAI